MVDRKPALVLAGALIAATVGGCTGAGKSEAQQLAEQFGHDGQEESAIVRAIKDLNEGSESLPASVKSQVEDGNGALDEITDALEEADPAVDAACDAYSSGALGVPDDGSLNTFQHFQAQTLFNKIVLQVRDDEVADQSVRTACAIHKVTSAP